MALKISVKVESGTSNSGSREVPKKGDVCHGVPTGAFYMGTRAAAQQVRQNRVVRSLRPVRRYLLDAVLSVPEPDPAAAAATGAPAEAPTPTPASAVASVSRVKPVMPAMPVTSANSASASPPAATPTRSHSPPFRRNLLSILASAVVPVVCALAWQRWHSPKQARVDHAMAARKSIAVLHLTDLNDKPSPWFAKAVMRDLRSWCIFAEPMRLN